MRTLHPLGVFLVVNDQRQHNTRNSREQDKGHIDAQQLKSPGGQRFDEETVER
jgi:hypothetical protein